MIEGAAEGAEREAEAAFEKWRHKHNPLCVKSVVIWEAYKKCYLDAWQQSRAQQADLTGMPEGDLYTLRGRLLAEFHARGLNAKIPAAPAQVTGEAHQIRSAFARGFRSGLNECWPMPELMPLKDNELEVLRMLKKAWEEDLHICNRISIPEPQPPATPDHDERKNDAP